MKKTHAISRRLVQAYTPSDYEEYRRSQNPYERDDPVGLQQLVSVAIGIHQHIARRQSGGRTIAQWLRVAAPYTFETMPNGAILPLNREYKPLGLGVYGVWVDYRRYAFQSIPADRLNLSWAYCIYEDRETRDHYMYDDICPPWGKRQHLREYLVRLKGLTGMVEA